MFLAGIMRSIDIRYLRVICAFAWLESFPQPADCGPLIINCPGGFGSQQGFEFGEDFRDQRSR